MKDVRKTIYLPQETIEALGKCSNYSRRIYELINKGLLYEEKQGKVTLEIALGYFNSLYRKKHPDKPLP